MKFKMLNILIPLMFATSSFANGLDISNLDFSQINSKAKELKETNDKLRTIVSNIDKNYEYATVKKVDGLPDIYELKGKKGSVYINKEGTHIFPVIAKIDGSKFTNIKELEKKDTIKNLLSNIPREQVVTYPATENKFEIFVFSDYTCPHCKKLHNELLNLNNLGITVHYIPYPRFGLKDKNTIKGLAKIMCSQTPTLEYDKAFKDPKNYGKETTILDGKCQNGLDSIHNSLVLGDKLNVQGTPYIFLSNGSFLGGWTNINNFKLLLNHLK